MERTVIWTKSEALFFVIAEELFLTLASPYRLFAVQRPHQLKDSELLPGRSVLVSANNTEVSCNVQ